jgi:ribonuclease E
VAIDVNSGKTTGDNVEDMAFKTNMEAAEEAARQLRLRDLAGLVVIDFIDMKREGNNRMVAEKLVDCLKEDKARMEVGKINRFGVLVMTRQRLRPSLQNVTHEACPTCQGTGKVKSMEALVLSVVRRIKAILSRDAIAEIRVKLLPAIAMAVLNQKRKELTNLEDVYDSRIVIVADPEIPYGEMAAEIERAEEGEAEKAPARASREKHLEIEDETVVLGGDSPISFEKALGEEGRRAPAPQAPPRESSEAEIKYERRDAQRAALDERERLRALFESAKPLGEDDDDELVTVSSAVPAELPAPGPRRGRGGRKPQVAADEGSERPAPKVAFDPSLAVPEAPAPAFFPPIRESEPTPAPQPEPILLKADLVVADLLTPSPRPRLMGGAAKEAAKEAAQAPAPAAVEAPVKAKRGRPRKVEAAPVEVIKAAPAPAKRSPKAKVKAEPAVAAAPAKSRKK